MKKTVFISFIVLIIILIAIFCAKFLKQEETQEMPEEKYYIEDGAIYEKVGDINENAIKNNIEKINAVCEKYLNDNNIFFSIIPDKEYYLKDSITTDFSELEAKVNSILNKKIEYINIADTLSLGDFYRTDMHWKQENLQGTVEKIENSMKLNNDSMEYEEKSLGDFYGSYYKEIENNVKADELIYFNNSVLENCKVYNLEKNKEEDIYNLEKVEETKNKYDLFLSGATALTTITNKSAKTDRKLILFRDSFGSSIAPLLAEEYKEIVLIDIRYINYTILENYIDFDKYKDADVLFLYSSRVINKSGIFR